MFFGEASSSQCQTLIEILDKFCSFSGQRVHFQKCRFFTAPWANVPSNVIAELKDVSKMAHCTDLGLYLGVPLHSARVNKNTYKHLLYKVKRKLSSWKANQFSLAGRAVLVQSVTSTIASYTMQSTRLPLSVAN